MSRIVYVNGRYMPFREARVHVEDRGYQFGDGVYEVCEIRDGSCRRATAFRTPAKVASMRLKIEAPMTPRALSFVMRETVTRNRVRDGLSMCRLRGE